MDSGSRRDQEPSPSGKRRLTLHQGVALAGRRCSPRLRMEARGAAVHDRQPQVASKIATRPTGKVDEVGGRRWVGVWCRLAVEGGVGVGGGGGVEGLGWGMEERSG
ncbi:uncharacterized protein PSFLO_02762 [Pseudozyma flocculosa]|uniref:Uncharacterized protein n=1 Tax=Pseudozyma flocculosa TaxID=84751 RepID=A0A5C3F1F2_9BASI|nr:uncharacterized protein PSFLO_02762 [Pseudozyma flocculosa]